MRDRLGGENVRDRRGADRDLLGGVARVKLSSYLAVKFVVVKGETI